MRRSERISALWHSVKPLIARGPGVSLEEAFENARVKIAQWEVRDGAPPSNPQAHFGAALSEKLRAQLGTGDKRHARAGDL
jgi:hypothetical protein